MIISLILYEELRYYLKKNALRSPRCGNAPRPAPAAKAAPCVPPKGGSPKNALRSPRCGYAPRPAPAAKAAPCVPPKGGSPKNAL